jgi:hypothetical protein
VLPLSEQHYCCVCVLKTIPNDNLNSLCIQLRNNPENKDEML